MFAFFEGLKISDEGYILREKGRKYFGCDNRRGYRYANIHKGRQNQRKIYMHRLVYKAFNPEVNIEGLDIHHKDGNRSNNHLSNLEPLNRGDNLEEAFVRRSRRNQKLLVKISRSTQTE